MSYEQQDCNLECFIARHTNVSMRQKLCSAMHYTLHTLTEVNHSSIPKKSVECVSLRFSQNPNSQRSSSYLTTYSNNICAKKINIIILRHCMSLPVSWLSRTSAKASSLTAYWPINQHERDAAKLFPFEAL